MRILIYLISSMLLFACCKKQSEMAVNFNCKKTNIHNLEVINDVKKTFSVAYPKNWKTNLYFDENQSSIFTADTTKQLTETVLLDISFINKEVNFNDSFKLQQEQESLSKNLIQTTSKEIKLLNKPTYYTISKGKKGKFPYQICTIFIKIKNHNFILAKTEVYGDDQINERMCQGVNLIEKIQIHH